MADTGKTVRVARTQFGGGLAQAGVPTERSQMVGHEVHQYRDVESDALGTLNDAIGRFMGAGVNALSTVQDGYQRGKLAQVEAGNRAQKAQALGDALAGKDMDPALEGDDDYYSAFRSVKAQRDGFDAAQDFTSWYMSEWLPENPMGDLGAARQQWALENITGSDDPEYEGQLIASFFDRTDGLLPEHMKAAMKFQTDKGVEALGSLIEADVASGSVTVEKFNDYFEKMRTLDPMNANEAPTRVVEALMVSAANHPDKMMGVSAMLAQPGTGVNGKSFAQSYPEAYQQFQQSAVASYNEVNSVRELETFTALDDRIRAAETPDELKDITVDLLLARQQFGAPGKVGALLDKVNGALADIGVDMDLAAPSMAWVGGDRSVDPGDVKKGFPLMLKQMGLKTILDAEPQKAAQIIAGLGGLPMEDVTAVMTATLLDTRSVEGQAKVIETLNILSKQVGDGQATSYLSADAKDLYDHVSALAAASNEPLDQLVGRVNEARETVKDWDIPWQKITGAGDAKEADKQVNDVITKSLNDALGAFGKQGLLMPLNVNKKVLEAARLKAIEFEASGLGWEAGVRSAVAGMVESMDILPAANGKFTPILNATDSSMYIEDVPGSSLSGLMNSAYQPTITGQRPRMGNAVKNPTTGRPVDTIQVFKDQANEIALNYPALLPAGRADQIFLAPTFSPDLKARGMYAVRGQDDLPRIFAAGTTIKISGGENIAPVTVGAMGVIATAPAFLAKDDREFVIPDNASAMNELFDLPEGFGFVRVDTPHGVTWHLGYRPNFGSQKGKSLDEQAAGFTASPIPAQPPAPTPVDLPMGSIDPTFTGQPLPSGITGGGF